MLNRNRFIINILSISYYCCLNIAIFAFISKIAFFIIVVITCFTSQFFFSFKGASLNCFDCTSIAENLTECVGNSTKCESEEKFCVVVAHNEIKGNDTKYTFVRSCANKEICGKEDYCEETMIRLLKKKECRFSCCEGDLCNKYAIALSVSSKDRILPACRSLLIGFCILVQFLSRQ